MWRIFIFICCTLFTHCADAAQNEVTNIRLGIHQDKTRLVIDLTKQANYRIASPQVTNHHKITINRSQIEKRFLHKTKGKSYIKQYYFKQNNGNHVLNIETNGQTSITTFVLANKANLPNRLVIDVKPNTLSSPKKIQLKQSHVYLPSPLPARKTLNNNSIVSVVDAIPHPLSKPIKHIIAIDPGHGGQDPGTLGPNGIMEKDITIAVAKHIRELLEEKGIYTVVLTRERDQFVPLRKRFAIARESNAELMLSLHADSNPIKSVKGLAVYTLSETATDKEAERLAAKENATDFLDNLSLTEKNEQEVSNILINLSQRGSKNQSIAFAECLMNCFDPSEVLSKNAHRSADFAVLKAPDMASVLIELGYLSNSRDQKRLVTEEYQRKIASRIVNAIDNYFERLKS